MKICTDCKLEKSFDEFNKKGKGYQPKCRPCQKIWYKNYYTNSEKEKARLYENRDAQREVIRDYIRKAKSVPCTDCGVSYPYYVMDFDHLGDKEFNISRNRGYASLATVKKEIAKCEVVCANCHRIRTFDRATAA
jgi:hypothetical protein